MKEKEEKLKEILGKELAEGLIQLTNIEPIIKQMLNFNTEAELAKNLAAGMIILVDMHTSQLNEIVKFAKVNASITKNSTSPLDPLATLLPADFNTNTSE